MKISANEAATKQKILGLINHNELSDEVRAKIIYARVECENTIDEFTKDVNKAIMKAQPEGYAEKFKKFRAAVEPTDDNKAEAEEQAAQDGFDEFKAEYDRFKTDKERLIEQFAKKEREVDFPQFTVADFADMARLFPSGAKTKIDDKEIDNNAVLHDIIAILKH